MMRLFYLYFVSCCFLFLPPIAEAGLKPRQITPSKAYIPKYSAIVMDADTGKILEQADAHGIRHPASLTKMMTLYLVFEALKSGDLKLTTTMTASRKASKQAPSKFGLAPDERVSVYQAIMGLITKSANDVAVVFAEHLSESEGAFARKMTQKAHALGMRSTVFKNASGLPHPHQVTSAYDMAVLSRALYRHFPEQYKYFKNQSFTHKGTIHRNHNHLLGKFPGLDGIKTGFIVASGFNLAASAVRYDAAQRPHRLITVVLGGPNRHWRDRRVAELLETNFLKMGLSGSLPGSAVKSPKVTPLVMQTPLDTPELNEGDMQEDIFAIPAVDQEEEGEEVDSSSAFNQLLEIAASESGKTTKTPLPAVRALTTQVKPTTFNQLLETVVSESVGATGASLPAVRASTTQVKPAAWVVPPFPNRPLKVKEKTFSHYTTVQVGRYGNAKEARRHATQARNLVGVGQPRVVNVAQGKKKLVAAQVTGLSEIQAKNLCQKRHYKKQQCLLIK
ncbi:D-alanyl-D-alanine carboxypeptidase family protein [Candidatus Paracaedibacter symbiosus]|uniref:D-alanyl-D-alanine carboxypeptidase family protein n=1 Tax=Candidatus Paracaedibacter symbiosus TaxID=244582 RepID=UPI00068FBA44|nr:D-alanyl-D-alanine carboxypeptidase family protein [Candidatus Paracaedibacter symbiosus]